MDLIMGKLERLVIHFIDNHNEHNMTLSFLIIRDKAVSLFKDLKMKAKEEAQVGGQ
jgi:hypothetical protein